jgi:hypothetical protein
MRLSGGRAAGISRCDAAGASGGTRGRRAVYVGAQILKTEGSPPIPSRFSMVEVWNAMMDQGRLIGHLHEGAGRMWAIPAGIAEAEAMVGHDAAL